MESRILKCFLVVAQTGNITKAAEQLNVSQPTLSRQLMALEDEVGTPLLVRGAREVTLTEMGMIFQQRASEIIALVEKTERDMKTGKAQLTGTVAIGCVESKVSLLLAKAMIKFREVNPHVIFDLYSGDGDTIKEKIEWGQLDLGIVLEPVEMAKYDFHPLKVQDTWGVLLHKEDPLSGRETLRADEVLDQPLMISRRNMVIEETAKWIGVSKSRIPVFLTQSLLSNTIPLIEMKAGRSITIQGAYQLRPSDQIKFIPLTPERTSGHDLIWKKNKVFNQATYGFLEFMKKFEMGE